MNIKTTKQIINDELGVILNSVDYDVNHSLFEINKNKQWISVEDLLTFINKERDNGNIVDGGFSAALCLSKLIKRLEGDKEDETNK